MVYTIRRIFYIPMVKPSQALFSAVMEESDRERTIFPIEEYRSAPFSSKSFLVQVHLSDKLKVTVSLQN